jgi:7-keto-8-aminopelargonate synthetase-like enzyme
MVIEGSSELGQRPFLLFQFQPVHPPLRITVSTHLLLALHSQPDVPGIVVTSSVGDWEPLNIIVWKKSTQQQMDFPAPSTNLERQLLAKLESRKSNSIFRQLVAAPKGSIDFSSNDFLSLSTSPQLRTAFLAELARHQNFPLGSGGSRLLDGNSDYADRLEREVARFHNASAGLLWTSGFDANSGLFACIPQPGDVILHDELIHASVHDGMRLSRAGKKIPFKHNCVDDLARILEALLLEYPALSSGSANIFVAVESVYSMDGDIAPLQEIQKAVSARLPRGNGHIIIDEAHGTGVLGPSGAGLVCELGLEDKIFARLHTFGKSLACTGGKLIRRFETLLILSSRYIVLPNCPLVPYQLCAAIDIHDVYAVSSSGRDQGVILPAPKRAHRQGIVR